MNWKSEAVEKLKKLELMRQAVQSIPNELSRLESEAMSIRGSAMDVPRVTGSGYREDALLSNLVHRQELSAALFQAESWVSAVEGALGVLSPEERTVLDGMYIDARRGGQDRLCETLQMEKSSLYRKRDRALRRFTLALYGSEVGN